MSNKLSHVHGLIHDTAFAISAGSSVVAQDNLKHADALLHELIEDRERLPSDYQVGDTVCLAIPIERTKEARWRAKVLAVHFHKGRVKYDLTVQILLNEDEESEYTRMYNIDPMFMEDKDFVKEEFGEVVEF